MLDVVNVTLQDHEVDALHALLVSRRLAFTKLCQQHCHSSPTIQQYISELKALEAKLMQVPLAEYISLDNVDTTKEEHPYES